jgi:hypothetical protein
MEHEVGHAETSRVDTTNRFLRRPPLFLLWYFICSVDLDRLVATLASGLFLGLFNDTLSTASIIALNGRVIVSYVERTGLILLQILVERAPLNSAGNYLFCIFIRFHISSFLFICFTPLSHLEVFIKSA